MNYSEIKALIANPGESWIWQRRYIICQEFGPIAIAYANCEQDALDEAADAGKFGKPLDWGEVEDDDDSIAFLGNASEPYWMAHTFIEEV